ncbi:DUF5995 family protein [Mycobacterium gastri]|uniref:DUF5995 family protein n=1 Tax=Mycobacterium gastri TaxID=1777 RepID=UPI001ABFE64A|nr:DUF5995 family protein [Mycobacterium gastri]
MSTIDDVIDGIQSIIEWSIETASAVGYFALVYQRATIAVRDAINQEMFDDGPRMTRFGVAFARRYFEALYSRFDGTGREPTRVWQVAFDVNASDSPIILQHILTAMTAHDTFDLGIAAAATAGDSLAPLQNDFDVVNAILASQVSGVLDAIGQVSPVMAGIRKLLGSKDISFVGAELKRSRDLAWTVAGDLIGVPEPNRAKIIDRYDVLVAAEIEKYLNPPWAISKMVRTIAKGESADVARNLTMLSRMAPRSGPVPRLTSQ